MLILILIIIQVIVMNIVVIFLQLQQNLLINYKQEIFNNYINILRGSDKLINTIVSNKFLKSNMY